MLTRVLPLSLLLLATSAHAQAAGDDPESVEENAEGIADGEAGSADGEAGSADANDLAADDVAADDAAARNEEAGAEDVDDEPPGYRPLVRQALSESAAGRWEEARVLFREAHTLYPNARTLRGIGMVAFELRDYVDAIRNLRASLASVRRPLDASQRAQVEALLQRAERFVGVYDASGLPEDTEVVVNGQPTRVGPDGLLILPVGEHELDVRAPPRRASLRLVVRGGEREPLPDVLTPPPGGSSTMASSTMAPSATTPTAPAASPVYAPSAPPPVGPWIGIVSGALSVVTGLALVGRSTAMVRQVEGASGSTEWSALSQDYDRAPRLGRIGVALIGAGLVAGTGGTVSLWLATRRSPTGESAGIQVGGAF